ncbi:ORF6N domain-containing protein [Pseudopedobacter beijingensis]|uniref:ORF6N domain-containing protein n=1 Tax=Pseudopedobacter beijingensis TaxID=1207056 RepID=A0ABW4I9Q3_9SPHI
MTEPTIQKQEVSVTDETVMSQIYMIRGQKVMLDRDLAKLYGVETFRLNEQVKRNISRFPEDFMFQLTKEEWESLTSQIAISKTGRGGRRTIPYVFTEYGVLMLSSVLNSERAVQVNIQIMRIFTKVRQMLSDNTEIKLEIAEIKQAVNKIAKKQEGQDKNIDLLFEYIDRLQEKAEEPKPERKRIGYKDKW